MNDNSIAMHRTAVVAGPHPVCHEGVRAILALLDIPVAAATCCPATAPDLAVRHHADLLLVDLDGPDGPEASLEAVREACRRCPRIVTVVLSAEGGTERLEAAVAAGADGYVVKTAQPEELAVAVGHALERETYTLGGAGGFVAHVRGVERPSLAGATSARLTRRELEVLQLAAEGRSNREVAKILWVTDQTVKFHLANVYRKLGVSGRGEAARWALANGLLDSVRPARAESGIRTVARALAGARGR